MKRGEQLAQTITVNGVRLEVARWGDAPLERLPILLMHEGLGSVAFWKRFPARLADATGREVIAWSRQGHGSSDPIAEARQPDYMHREAETLPEIYRQLGIERGHWFGQSDGGSIALIGAARFPDLVDCMILEAPHVLVEDITVSSIAEVGRHFATSDMGERMKRYHADPGHIFRKWNDIWLDPAFRSWNIEDVLPAISAPTLLIQGRDDEYGTMDQLDRIEVVLPHTRRLELDDCGHSPHHDQELAVIEATIDFLKARD